MQVDLLHSVSFRIIPYHSVSLEMERLVYNFRTTLNWQLLLIISQLDRFDAEWTSIERRERHSLKQLKSIATIRSVGASTRIEGSRLTDEEVDTLLKSIDITKLEDRDSQEVVGYFNVLDFVADSHADIEVSEGNIKNLHKNLMKYSAKDQWHKGAFKKHRNAVEAKYPNGTSQIIFRTAEPGLETETAMNNLINWYNGESEVHPLVKCAVFTYEFLSIHPFQDGNGRLSRLLSALLLLKNGYKWIQYISFEHEIENRKSEYYRVLRSCQAQRPNEDISEWTNFFLDALKNIQHQLMQKLQVQQSPAQPILPREELVVRFIESHPGCKSGDIIKGTGISRMIVIRLISTLIEKGLIEKHGSNSGTHYKII